MTRAITITISDDTYELDLDQPIHQALFNAGYELNHTRVRALELTAQLRKALDRTDAMIRRGDRYPDGLNYSPGPYEITQLLAKVEPLMDQTEAWLRLAKSQGLKPVKVGS